MKIDWKITLFAMLIVLAIGLRCYNFSDWLIFKSDQVRDSIMVSRSYNNDSGELPLLGPRAAGTLLRLGPIFYYFQYASSVIFSNDSPAVMAYPNLLFSILAIPVFFLLIKKYFNRDWSMILTVLFSFSYVAIEYSRFAWNPNSIPFFNLLYFYAILEIFNPDAKRRFFWIVISAIALSVSTQLHFTSFIALPVFTIVFIIFRFSQFRKFINWKYILIFLSIIILFYLPVILSDIVNKGDNAKLFYLSVSNKSSSQPFLTKIYKDTYYFGKYFLRILAGYIEYNRWWFLISAGFIGLSFLTAFKDLLKEKDPNRKNFLFLVVLSFLISFALYIPLATKIDKPRFFLPVIHIPFIFLGILLKEAVRILKNSHFIKYATGLALLVLFGSNVFFVASWFREFERSQAASLDPQATVVLKGKGDSVWWTWWHFQKTGNYIIDDCQKSEIYYVMPKKMEEYTHQIEYVLQKSGDKRPIHIMAHKVDYNSKGCYYYIGKTDNTISNEIEENFNLIKRKAFGDIEIISFDFPDGKFETIDLDKKKIKTVITEIKAATQELTQVADSQESDDASTDEEVAVNEKQVNKRLPRIYWKDIFAYFN
jgi:hypothetical protein